MVKKVIQREFLAVSESWYGAGDGRFSFRDAQISIGGKIKTVLVDYRGAIMIAEQLLEKESVSCSCIDEGDRFLPQKDGEATSYLSVIKLS